MTSKQEKVITIPNISSACYAMPGFKYFDMVVEKKTSGMDDLYKIEEKVCLYYGVDKAILHKKCRFREIVIARQTICYFARLFTILSLKSIGSYYNQDHTTVLHAIATLKDLMYSDSTIADNIIILKQIIAKN